MRFGEYLVSSSFVTDADIERALRVQHYRKERIGRLLEDLGAISSVDLHSALQGFFALDAAPTLTDVQALPALTLSLSAGLQPGDDTILRQAGTGVLVMTSRVNDAYLRRLEAATDGKVSVRLIPSELLARLARMTEGEHQQGRSDPISRTRGDEAGLEGSSAYAALYRDAVATAHKVRASDIHFMPTADGMEIIFRVFGVMSEPWTTLGVEHRQGFTNELKRLAKMSIAISGKPQDSRVSYPGIGLDLRAGLIQTQYGEKIVMRLLDQSRIFSLDSLQIGDASKNDFRGALRAKSGVVLISGPTGSGKTTTLYSAVSSLDRRKLNIVTVEDPIEYTLPGITQIGVNAKLSFAGALRAILRQDPDVILVGEVRDEETADLCFKAASTGHLVLSTIHANSAVEVVQRLLGLGVEKYLMASCLRFSVAQRVVGQICPGCSSPASESVRFAAQPTSGATYRVAGTGCEQCRNGLVGLLPIFEYMDRTQIDAYAASDFASTARPKVSLLEAYCAKAKDGLVDARGAHDFA